MERPRTVPLRDGNIGPHRYCLGGGFVIRSAIGEHLEETRWNHNIHYHSVILDAVRPVKGRTPNLKTSRG